MAMYGVHKSRKKNEPVVVSEGCITYWKEVSFKDAKWAIITATMPDEAEILWVSNRVSVGSMEEALRWLKKMKPKEDGDE